MFTPRFRPDVVYLRVLGRDRSIEVQVPEGPSRLVDILPAARALADGLTSAAAEAARSEGRAITCRAGCGACCRQLVGISAIEAQGLAELVAALPEERRVAVEARFRAALRRLEKAGLLGEASPAGFRNLRDLEPGRGLDSAREVSRKYMALRIACPFLEAESCGIYADRPMMCREYNVSSPAELCADPHGSPVRKVNPPIHLGTPLARTAGRLVGIPVTVLPFVLCIEWARCFGERMGSVLEGSELYAAFLSNIDADHATPFGERSADDRSIESPR